MADKAEDWLHKMLDRYEEKGRKDTMKPSSSLLGAVLGVLKRRKRDFRSGATSFYKMQSLVARYEKLAREGLSDELPDSRVYASLISMISSKDVADKKVSILVDLVQKLRQADLQRRVQDDNVFLTPPYRHALRTLVRGNRLDLATELLHTLIDDYLSDPSLSPLDGYCVMNVLEGWADHPDGANAWKACTTILQRLGYHEGNHDPSKSKVVRVESYETMIKLAEKLSLDSEVVKLKKALKTRNNLKRKVHSKTQKAGKVPSKKISS
jgi:hypothetical protein